MRQYVNRLELEKKLHELYGNDFEIHYDTMSKVLRIIHILDSRYEEKYEFSPICLTIWNSCGSLVDIIYRIRPIQGGAVLYEFYESERLGI